MESPLGQRLRELPGPLLLTGHTGFKGSWMIAVFNMLGADVKGYSLPPAHENGIYNLISANDLCDSFYGDINDFEKSYLIIFLVVIKESFLIESKFIKVNLPLYGQLYCFRKLRVFHHACLL